MSDHGYDSKERGQEDASDKFRAFAKLAADWFWELDEHLCYRFHDGKAFSVTGLTVDELVGQNRIEILNAGLKPSAALTTHNECMSNRLPVDVILPIEQGDWTKYVHVLAEPQFDANNKFIGYLGCGRDVSTRVQLEEELAHLATHDDLTGVINRREFERQLELLHARACEENQHYTLCIIDLDRFKQVNDTAGHPAGDQLLREIVTIMRKHIQVGETLARLGGDEFGLLLRSDVIAARKVVDTIIDEVATYNFVWNGHVFRVGASIGMAPVSADTDTVDSLLVQADNACYAAKNNGRNQSHVAEGSDQRDLSSNVQADAVADALQAQQFQLLMQPIVSTGVQESYKRFELLLRLKVGEDELLEPSRFMPLAKRYSLLQDLDFWVIENALAALETRQALGDDIALSINLSACTLTDADALQSIISIFDQHAVPEQRVCFDITETHAIRNIELVSEFMNTLRNRGVEFALDDFGDGLSSFTYLQHLPISYLKIDGELIRKVANDQTSRCITEAFNDLSHRLNIKTVAESVEDVSTIHRIREIGIDYMQGFAVADLIELESLPIVGPTAQMG